MSDDDAEQVEVPRLDPYSDAGDVSEGERLMNQAMVDAMDPGGFGSPIDWDAMPPIEWWDAETLIVLKDGRQVRAPQD